MTKAKPMSASAAFEKRDAKMDKKMGIKENSKRDTKMDAAAMKKKPAKKKK